VTQPQGLERLDPALANSGVLFHIPMNADSIATIRTSLNERRRAAAEALDTTGVQVTLELMPTDIGDVPVRIYRPTGVTAPPVVLFLHSGALLIGNLDTDHARCVELAREVRCAVVSVDYRLAPEHPYPAAFDDCAAVAKVIAGRAADHGFDPARWALAGNSAGAGLAAAIALWIRDERLAAPALQLLHQPMLDPSCATPSMREFTATPGFDSQSAAYAWASYLAGGDATGYAAASTATDLTGLPPAHIACSEIDPLRDEAILYASRLVQSGVSTHLVLVPGTCHGYDSLCPDLAVSRRTVTEQVRVLRSVFE
jgi:acetyl esterase/lipase